MQKGSVGDRVTPTWITRRDLPLDDEEGKERSKEEICLISRDRAGEFARGARAETFAERTERPTSPGILTPYETSLRTRWAEGERNARGLFHVLPARGSPGSHMTIERFLLGLRRMEHQGREVSHAAPSVDLRPPRAVGLMLHRSSDLTKEESLALSQVCQLHPQVRHLNALFQQFAQMLRHRRGEERDQWLHAAFHSGIPQ